MSQYSRHPDSSEAFAPSTQAASPRFPLMTAEAVEALNACYVRHTPLQFDDGDLSFNLATRLCTIGSMDESVFSLKFNCGGSRAHLAFPRALLETLISSYSVDLEQISESSLLLLLEHRLSAILSTIERGMNGVILFEKLEPGRLAMDGGVWVEVSCRIGRDEHSLALALPLSLARSLGGWLQRLPQRAGSPAVTVALAIRAGFAVLSLSDIRSLRLHDVVLVHSPLGGNEMLAVAGERYGARVESAVGKSVLVGSFAALGEDQRKVWSMSANADDAVGARALDGNLDDIQIKLVFEVGRKEIELADLRRLAEGHVFDLGRDTRTAVDILAGSRRIGQGELVQVQETLGVRITRLFDHG